MRNYIVSGKLQPLFETVCRHFEKRWNWCLVRLDNAQKRARSAWPQPAAAWAGEVGAAGVEVAVHAPSPVLSLLALVVH